MILGYTHFQQCVENAESIMYSILKCKYFPKKLLNPNPIFLTCFACKLLENNIKLLFYVGHLNIEIC